MHLSFTLLPGDYAITALPYDAALPDWLDGPGLVSFTRDDHELSVVCLCERVPRSVRPQAGWAALRVDTLADLDAPGVVMAAVTPIAAAGLGVFVLSTNLRDFLLVRTFELGRVGQALEQAGHSLA